MQRRWMVIGMCVAVLAITPAMAQSAGYGDTNLETRLTDLETQLRAVNGRLEQSEWQNKQLRANLERLQIDLEQRLVQLEHRPATAGMLPNNAPQAGMMPPSTSPNMAAPARPLPTGNSVNGEAADGEADDSSLAHDPRSAPPDRNLTAENIPGGKPVAGQLGKLYMSGGQVKGADREAVTPTLPPKPDDYGLTPQEQYDRAFHMLRESNFGGAEEAFKGFIGKNPKDKLIDNAKYWLGETYYARGKFDAAAVAFAEAYQSAPKGSKAADSLFKLGMALEGLNKREDACTTFAEVKSQFPHAASAMKTKVSQEVKKLKCKS